MLLYGHNLDTIVSLFGNAWQNFLAKFIICSNFFLLLCHTDVAFVNQQWIGTGFKGFLFKFKWLLRCPYLSTEYFGAFILHDPVSPSGNSFSLTTFPVYM